jgi:hypothetical protein
VFFGESSTFLRNILPPFSGLMDKPKRKPAETGGKLNFLLLLVSGLAYSSTFKMAEICFYETSGSLRKTQPYNS